ncbi:HAD family hydrolase [uncultured Allomuricauda sp.]|uniref:HAD family hydrolase n=1 Tax=Flagellimonas sp. W118 TaxID=3410791 RepID=UPI00261A89FF|nr:HAD family hydrolase [uncultured Allomuricauda sp.]
MDLSKIKIVVSDMDGTLLNSNHRVSDRFFEIFAALQAKNIRFVAASGRQYHSMADKLHKIKNDIIFISENGALVKEGDEELSVTPINQSLTNELLKIVDSIDGAYAMLCGKYKSYFDGNSMSFLEQLKEYYSQYEVVEDYLSVTDEIVKIAVYHGVSAEEYIYPKTKHLNDQVKVKVSGQNWVDLNHIEAHKGNALQKVMDIYNIKSDEVLVFGDYNNDLEMLSLADNSFAMANAHPNVKKIAKFETASNDDFGVERILEKLI